MNKISVKPNMLEIYFSEYVRFLCRTCKRYSKKSTCPPFIESVEYYKNKLTKYENGIIVYEKFIIIDINKWRSLGKKSSIVIYRELTKMKKELSNKGINAIILGAGSCKICTKCEIPCKCPEKAIIPLEATGINVISLFYNLAKIELKFPVEEYGYFYRIGMILW